MLSHESRFSVTKEFDVKLEAHEIRNIFVISERELLVISEHVVYQINDGIPSIKLTLDLCASEFDYTHNILIGVTSTHFVIYNLKDPPRQTPLHQDGVYAMLKSDNIVVTIGSNIRIWDYTPNEMKLRSVLRLNFHSSIQNSLCIDNENEALLIPTEKGFMNFKFDGTMGKLRSDIPASPGDPVVLNSSYLITAHENLGVFLWNSCGLLLEHFMQEVKYMWSLVPNFILLVDAAFSIFVLDISSNTLFQVSEGSDSMGFAPAKIPILWMWKDGILEVNRIRWPGQVGAPAVKYEEELQKKTENIVKVIFGKPVKCDRSTSPLLRDDEEKPTPVEVPKLELPKLSALPREKPVIVKSARNPVIMHPIKRVRKPVNTSQVQNLSPHIIDMNQVLSARLPLLNPRGSIYKQHHLTQRNEKRILALSFR